MSQNELNRVRDVMMEHGILFHNEPHHDDRPDVENRQRVKSWFSHEKWGELEVDTTDQDAMIEAFDAWVEANKPAKKKRSGK